MWCGDCLVCKVFVYITQVSKANGAVVRKDFPSSISSQSPSPQIRSPEIPSPQIPSKVINAALQSVWTDIWTATNAKVKEFIHMLAVQR